MEVSMPITNRNPNWLRRFVVLNAVLFGMPILLMAATWLALSANGMQLSGTSGNVGLATLTVAGCYFIVPNLVMVLVWTIGRNRTRGLKDRSS